MKIACLGYAHGFGSEGYYGAERIIWYLIQELKKKGHECVVFSVKGCNLPGFEYIEMPKPWDDNVDIYYEAIKTYEATSGTKFDIVQSYQASGFIDDRLRNEYNYCLNPYFRFINFKENLIAYSEKLNELDGGTATTIYYGIPEDLYSDYSAEHDDYLVWIGRIDMGKGPLNAIEVAKRANKRIILMGPAYHYPHFHDTIYPHIDGDKVIWLRAVDDNIKRRVFRKALAFINPIWEHYHEMFGITNIESLACGVPIIGWGHSEQTSAINYRPPASGEIIEHGKHGFIVEYSDYDEACRQKAIGDSVAWVDQLNEIKRSDCRDLYLNRFTSKIMADKCEKYYSIIKERGKVLNVTNELG